MYFIKAIRARPAGLVEHAYKERVQFGSDRRLPSNFAPVRHKVSLQMLLGDASYVDATEEAEELIQRAEAVDADPGGSGGPRPRRPRQ